jgi:hypothetical protein
MRSRRRESMSVCVSYICEYMLCVTAWRKCRFVRENVVQPLSSTNLSTYLSTYSSENPNQQRLFPGQKPFC